jgi:endonuclease/exonuclease/phosphatase family metal-dependent hydrolase
LVVFLFAVPTLQHLFAVPDAASRGPAHDVPTVSVLTANQRFFRDGEGENIDSTLVVRAFESYDADIALLQEVRSDRFQLNFMEDIRRTGDLREQHQQDGTFIATYAGSITPIRSRFVPPNEYNGYLVTDVDTEIGTLRVINAHLQTNQISEMARDIGNDEGFSSRLGTLGHMLTGYGRATRTRAWQAEELREAVEESPHPVILGGDFNDVPSSYTYNHILSPRLQDAWSVRGLGLGTTFTGPLPGLRIDFLLVDTSLAVVDIERLPPLWSDHRPLRAVISR